VGGRGRSARMMGGGASVGVGDAVGELGRAGVGSILLKTGVKRVGDDSSVGFGGGLGRFSLDGSLRAEALEDGRPARSGGKIFALVGRFRSFRARDDGLVTRNLGVLLENLLDLAGRRFLTSWKNIE
jgi:hypothetical protein